MTRNDMKEKALDLLQSCKSGMDTLQFQRERLLKLYQQDKSLYENIDGRSQIVTSDVHDVIETVMPQLMKIFYSGDDAVKLVGQGPDDEQKARLFEELLNFQFQRQMNGYEILHDWFKDALMFKMGVVKYSWENGEEYKAREYKGLSDAELMALQANPDFIIDKLESVEEITEIATEFEVIQQVTGVHTVKGRDVVRYSRPCIEVIPPEEFIFDVNERYKKELTFAAHKKRMHKEAIKAKWKVSDDDLADEYDAFSDTLVQQRFEELGGLTFWNDTEDSDYCYIYECCMTVWEAGKARPMKLVILGNRLLEAVDNTYGKPNYCLLSPYRQPHRLVGYSLAEKAEDSQRIRTSLTRSIMDNVYFQNNGVRLVNPFRVNVSDLLSGNRPGGIVRMLQDVPVTTALQPMPVNPLGSQVFGAMELIDSMRENKTGVTKYNQGTDSNSLNKTATGISIITSMAQERVAFIARTFAETGVKDLFQALVDMNLEFFNVEVSLKVNREWATVDRAAIDGKYDLKIDVGLGVGTKELTVQQMLNMLQVSYPLVQMGIVTPLNLYEIVKVIYENLGYKNAERFATPPQMNQMPVPGMMPVQGGFPDVSGLGGGVPPQAAAGFGTGGMEGGGGQQAPFL